jgi:hypothetical protein
VGEREMKGKGRRKGDERMGRRKGDDREEKEE